MKIGSRQISEPAHTPSSRSNRAEDVRQRRTQRSQQRVSAAAGRVATPARSNPVIMRGILNRQAEPLYRQASSSNPRRTFYIAMDGMRNTGVAGAELRLPAIRLVNPGWRMISGLLACVMLFALFSVWNSPFFRVSNISILGLQRLSSDDLESVIHLDNLSIIEIQPDKVKEEIALAFPELADVQVKVELPNFVTVTARERQPALAWQKGETTYWVDAEGIIFPVRGEAGALVTIHSDDEIPLVRASAGPVVETDEADNAQEQPAIKTLLASMGYAAPTYFDRRAEMKILNASLQLVKLLPEGTQIVYDKRNGMGWSDAGGWQVFIGKDLENFEAKIQTYQTIARDLESKGIRPVLISVEHLNAPFYRASQRASNDTADAEY
jgi:hypothetical protein